MKIPTFEEYFINEGVLSKTLNRSKYNIVREEDKSYLDKVCKIAGEFIAKKIKINYSPDLCTYEDDEEENKKYEDLKNYFIRLNFGELGEEYSDIVFSISLDNSEIDNFNDTCSKFASCLDYFQSGDFEYEDYKDPYIPSKKIFNKIKRCFEQLVDFIYKQIN